jgi:uncharacterized membrane protein SpoIIM required for sporulation
MSAEIRRAMSRARTPILTIGLTYAVTLLIGLAMVHTGNSFALSFRDDLVARAHRDDPSSQALQAGTPLNAALLDFSRNLLLGAAPDTLGGLVVVLPYPTVAYRGWVGGIVSVDGAHASRLAEPLQAAYYISVVLMQLVPYSLAAGAGINLGLAYFRPPPYYRGRKWLGYPVQALRDLLWIYLLVVPLFLVASLWEFLSPWN